MSQTVLAAGGDDNPRDEMKSFGDEGDEAEAAEHLDDELGLKQELENGDDRLVCAMPADMSAVGASYRGGMPVLYSCPPYHASNMEPPPLRMGLRPPPLTPQPQPVASSTTYDHGQSWNVRGQAVPLSSGQYMSSMNNGLPRLQHHPQQRFYGQYPMQQGGMHPQMGMMMPYQQQFQQGGMVMQQPGYPPQVVQHQQGAGMIPMSQPDNIVPGPHVKKPLNAFMLYMKEMRQHVVKECTLKESAAINQILGRKWHALDRSEQAKYYEMARRERALHQQLFPGWSARDNYAIAKKKKKKRDKSQTDAAALKKCRARYGLDQQQKWCKPCRRKKKCIRFTQIGDCPSGDEGQGIVDEVVTVAEDVKVEVVETNGNGIDEDVELGKPVLEETTVEAESQTVDIVDIKEE